MLLVLDLPRRNHIIFGYVCKKSGHQVDGTLSERRSIVLTSRIRDLKHSMSRSQAAELRRSRGSSHDRDGLTCRWVIGLT